MWSDFGLGPAGEEQLRNMELTPQDRRVQRRAAIVVHAIHGGAVIEEDFRDIFVAMQRGNMERRCSAARGLIVATTFCKQTGFEPSDTCIATTFTSSINREVAAMCDEAHAVADKPCPKASRAGEPAVECSGRGRVRLVNSL